MELLSFIAFNSFSKPQTIKVLAKLAFKSMLLIFSYLCLQIQVTNYQWKLCVEIHSGTTINKYKDLSIYQTPNLVKKNIRKSIKSMYVAVWSLSVVLDICYMQFSVCRYKVVSLICCWLPPKNPILLTVKSILR